MSDAWSTTLLASRAPADVVKRNRERTTKERHAAEMDAFAFLTQERDTYRESGGELDRDYDPMPYPEAMPTPESDYVGTGIGLLYGLGGEQHAWQLAGWNVRRSA